jgi:3-deoxy-manno-octulosonate cytidylyltransferase (CMP-KDO synthetase)
MKYKPVTRILTIAGLIFLALSLGYAGLISLQNSNIVDRDSKAKLTDWVSTGIGSLALVSGAFTLWLAYRSFVSSQKTEEGRLYIEMMNRYSSRQMVDALRLLGRFNTEAKADLEGNIKNWYRDKNNSVPYALDIEDARHLVKYFYRDLMQIVQADYFSRDLAKRICNTGGRHIFKNLVLKMDSVLNEYGYENEFYPFEEIYNELEMEQNNIYNRKVVCLIPARQDASRFPDKLLMLLKDKNNKKEKTVIRETYERMKSYGIFAEVYVVTNSEKIRDEIEMYHGKVVYQKIECQSGTDRIGAAAKELDADIIFNVQGDEPFIDKKPLEEMIALMKKTTEPELVTSLMKKMKEEKHIQSSDYVKVVCSNSGTALYFSRSRIPFEKNTGLKGSFFEHVGVYAFSKKALIRFLELAPSPLEKLESVECLRFTENDIPIKMIETDTFLIEIDTPADLDNVNNLLEAGRIQLS